MYILVARHGKAEEKKPGLPDEERRLTEEGRSDVANVAKLLPWTPQLIYTSPLRRAHETAEVISQVLGGVEVKVVDILRPELTSVENLKKLEFKEITLLVGHAPSIEKLISGLVGGGAIKLKAGAIAGLEAEIFDVGKAVLRFIISPDVAKKCFGV